MLPHARKNDLVIQESGRELLVYDLKKNRAISLNETSASIWEKCDGTKSPREIQQVLVRESKANITEDLVWLALEQLNEEDLLQGENEFAFRYKDVSRRSMIKKIGMASSIALPIILSIKAPKAVNAQSVACVSKKNGCTCPVLVGIGNECFPILILNKCANSNCKCISRHAIQLFGDCEP